MEEDLRNIITANSGVSALVSDRVFWVERTQGGVLPAVVLTRLTGQRDHHSEAASGLVQSLVQVDCWSITVMEAKELAAVVIAALKGFNATVGSTQFQGIFINSERDFRPEPSGGKAAEVLHRVSVDIEIWHDE